MADSKIRLLGLREVRFSDSLYYLTALAEDGRKLEVRCRDTRKRGGQAVAVARPFEYIACVLAERGGKYTLREADLVHSFFPLSQDIQSYALACYLAELVSSVTQPDESNPALCRLLLGALYALETRRQEAPLVKAAFEWRVIAESGYAPDLDTCGVCRETVAQPHTVSPAGTPAPPFFSVAAATVAHASCARRVGGDWTRLAPGTYQAIRSVLSRPPDHVYAFGLTGAARGQFCTLAEQYVLYRLEHSFDSLSFYHSLLKPTPFPTDVARRSNLATSNPANSNLASPNPASPEPVSAADNPHTPDSPDRPANADHADSPDNQDKREDRKTRETGSEEEHTTQ